MPDAAVWIAATRSSHERFVALLSGLDDAGVTAQSYDTDWTIADVASHLGSGAEIFGLFLDTGFAGEPAPGGEVFGPIWDRWNALPPTEQVRASIDANAAFVARIETLSDADLAAFPLSMFGLSLELPDLLAMRLGEHAVHTWDIAVALDPSATVGSDAVELLVDTVPATGARTGKPIDGGDPVVIATTEPERQFAVTVSPEVAIEPADAAPDLTLPAEAFIRLIFGRLDPEHAPADVDEAQLTRLRQVFPGF